MRRWVLAAVMTVAAHGAWAADLPDLSDVPLRGSYVAPPPTTMVIWQGAYIGGQVGYSGANMDFSKATQSLTSYMLENTSLAPVLSNWTLLGKDNPNGLGFGAFVGYNGQWDEAVISVEANYSHLNGLTGSQSNNSLPSTNIPGGCIVVVTGDTDICGAKLSGTASAQVTDTLTLRGRGAYAIGNFLPYMFGGLAAGRINVSRSATVVQTDQVYDSSSNFLYSSQKIYNQSQTSTAYAFGYTMGFGVEAMLWGGLFARGEYEFISFGLVQNVNVQMSTVRGALGYKF